MTSPSIALCAAAMAVCSPLAIAQDVEAIPATSTYDTLGTRRIDQIAGWLPATPAGIGPRCADRAAWSDPADVLVSLAGPGELLAITIKSADNSLGHAHDDVGSYSLAVGDEQPTGDPGKPVYDASTFTNKRRAIKLINSYGHPVPLVAGQLQIDGGKATPRVVSKTLTDAKDTMVIDLRPAYDVPTLTTLTRTMTRKRGKAESIATRDDFTFARPESFETAMVTGGEAKIVDAGTIEFQRGKRRVRASVKASSAFSLTPETIIDAGVTFTRIAVQLRDKHKRGHVTDTFTNSR